MSKINYISENTSFNRKIKDVSILNENSTSQLIVLNALGIDENDITFRYLTDGADNSYFMIWGKTSNKIINEDTEINYEFSTDITSIEKIEYFTKDGYLYVIINRKVETTVPIPVNKISPSDYE